MANFGKQQPRVKVISRQGYKHYDADLSGGWSMGEEFYHRPCHACGQSPWEYCLEGADLLKPQDYQILFDWNLAEGYGLVCLECYEKFRTFAEERKVAFDHYYDE